MSEERKLHILGTGWISGTGYGTSGMKPQFSRGDAEFVYPDLPALIGDLPSRYGRFDTYTKVIFAAAVLALSDAGLLQREGKRNIGVIVGSYAGVADVDAAFYATTHEAKGEFASPNLFSYTLPNVAIGEIAVFFGFTGPTFCVGNDPANPGADLLPAAEALVDAGICDTILVGWVETAQSVWSGGEYPKGAAFAVLSTRGNQRGKAFEIGPDRCFMDGFEV